MDQYLFRPANLNDVPFLAEVIMHAERGMSDNLSYCTLFELTEIEAKQYITDMLNEEIDGCELSVSSFIVVEFENKAVAALGGWIEGFYDGMSSQILKANLINYTLGRANIEKLQNKLYFLKELQMNRTIGTMQIEYLYVGPEHIGKKIEVELLQRLEQKLINDKPDLKDAEAQLFKNSIWSIKLLMKFGYTIVSTIKSSYPEVKNFLPYDEKILMKKKF
jgi:hypothetical protein